MNEVPSQKNTMYETNYDKDINSDEEQAEQSQNNTGENVLKCSGRCDAIQKNFAHKDELDLHLQFYHGARESSNTQ